MKILSTAVCAALLAGLTPAYAQTSNENTHPVLRKRPPREVLNSDLLALPERERQAWIHGALSLTVHMLSDKDAELGRCLLDWYFEVGNGAELIEMAFNEYREVPPTATIIALAERVCSGT